MNMSEVADMRELDIQIAELIGFRVFRPCDVKWGGRSDGEWYGDIESFYVLPKKKRPATHMIDAKLLPSFSTYDHAAMQLADRFWKGDLKIWRQNGLWGCDLYEPSMQWSAFEETLSMAICKAFLSARESVYVNHG